jgi:hypothetical protein
MSKLMGSSFCDFRMPDDGVGDYCYAFIKCSLEEGYMEKLRRSPHVLMVLESYDSPTFLGDDEVENFIVVEDEVEAPCLAYGDEVKVGGDSPYVGLCGIAVFAGCEATQVLFRFHTISRRIWLPNRVLRKTGNVFSRLKFPVADVEDFLRKLERKHPVSEDDNADSKKSDRDSN